MKICEECGNDTATQGESMCTQCLTDWSNEMESAIIISPTADLTSGDRVRSWSGAERWGTVVLVTLSAATIEWDEGTVDTVAFRANGKRLDMLRAVRPADAA